MSNTDSQTATAADPGSLAPTGAGTGLITQPQSHDLSPAVMAEQQRAKSEIEAALTIAATRPRDEKFALDVPVFDGHIYRDVFGQERMPDTPSPWDSSDMFIASSQLAKRRERQESDHHSRIPSIPSM